MRIAAVLAVGVFLSTPLLALSAPITYVAAQLGHAKPTMTLAAYSHWIPTGDRALAGRLEALRTSGPQAVRKEFSTVS